MGKSTIIKWSFSIAMLNYQRVLMFHIFCKTLPNSDVCLHLQPCLGHCSAGLSGSSYRKSKEAFVAEFLAIRKYHGMGFYMFLSPLIPLSWNILEPEPRFVCCCLERGAFAWPWARSFWTASRVLAGLLIVCSGRVI